MVVHLLGRRDHESTNLTEPTKSSRSKLLTMYSPRWRQPSRSLSRSLISSSLRSAIFVGCEIASLVPSATEMLFALGLGDQVVAVTHECDYPPEAACTPTGLTRSLSPRASAGEIDAEVRRLAGEGRPLYELDEPTLPSSTWT